MRRFGISILVALAVIGGAFAWTHTAEAPIQTVGAHQTAVTLGNTSVIADIADTEALREQGLSGRRSLDDAHGMLFIFQSEGGYSFWMKDMLFPIDIIWLSADKRVVHIAEYAEPSSYSESFTPKANALYVLEVPAGWSARHQVKVGSVAAF